MKHLLLILLAGTTFYVPHDTKNTHYTTTKNSASVTITLTFIIPEVPTEKIVKGKPVLISF